MAGSTSRTVAFGTKLVLLVGFGGVLALMGVAGYDSVRVLYRVEAGDAAITRTYLLRRHALERIRSQLVLAGGTARDFLLEPDAALAQTHRAALVALRGNLDRAFDDCSQAARPDEKQLISSLRAGFAQWWNALAPALEWTDAERRARGFEFFSRQLAPRRAALFATAGTIDAVNERALSAGTRRSSELFRGFRRRMAIMLATALSLGALLAALSILYILRLEAETRGRYQEIVLARQESQRLSARLVEAQEQERRSISRELHDEIGQSLGALLLDVSQLTAAALPGDGACRLGSMKKLLETTLNAVRNMALLLRPSMLDDFGLAPALEWHAREVGRRTGIRVQVDAEDVPDEFSEELKTCAYRIVQEALHNAARHAGARNIRIVVRRYSGRLTVEVKDDGKGFDTRRTRGLGLLGMEERVRNVGGSLEVESFPGRGTRIAAELPLDHGLSIEART